MKRPNKHNTIPGPKPDLLRIDGNWEDAAAKVVKVPRPPEGWPEPTPRRKPAKKKASRKKA